MFMLYAFWAALPDKSFSAILRDKVNVYLNHSVTYVGFGIFWVMLLFKVQVGYLKIWNFFIPASAESDILALA